MNEKQLDLKVNEYIARNVRLVEVGILGRTEITMHDGRFYEMDGEGSKVIELASAPVSGAVCKETLRRMNIMMHTQYRFHSVIAIHFAHGKCIYTRTANGTEWFAES